MFDFLLLKITKKLNIFDFSPFERKEHVAISTSRCLTQSTQTLRTHRKFKLKERKKKEKPRSGAPLSIIHLKTLLCLWRCRSQRRRYRRRWGRR